MAEPTHFDADAYTRLPNFSVRSAISIAAALLDLTPPVESAAVRSAKARLRARMNEAKALLARRAPKDPQPSRDAVALDLAADRAWSALAKRLEAYATLSDNGNPRIQKSRALLHVLFGNDGLSFVNSSYAEQAATTEALLARIDAESLQRDIEQCAGRDFIELVRALQPEYDAMVREFLARDAQNESLRPAQIGLQKVLSQYATAVLGAIDPEDNDHIAAVTTALAPLANAKRSVLAASSGVKSTPGAPDDGK